MTKYIPLTADKLRAALAPERIPYESSEAIPRNGRRHQPQQRALQALELGLHITARDFNIYLAGEPDLGRTFLLRDFLAPRVKKGQTPPDLVYVYNFDDQDRPLLISLPAGQGRKLKEALTKAFSRLQKEIGLRLERNAYTKRRTSLMDSFQSRREQLLKQMDEDLRNTAVVLGVPTAGRVDPAKVDAE